MTAWGYIARSVAYYRFGYAGVLAGAVLGATVLLGALFAGDSVAASLRRIAGLRVGQATHLVSGGDRFFRQGLATDLVAKTRVKAAPVLYVRGTATQATTRAAANQVQLVGVTDAFWSLAPQPTSVTLPASAAALAVNETLARRLNLVVGDTLVLRLHQPGILAGNAPVAGAETKLQTLRGKVSVVLGDGGFGRFTLESTQVAQPTVFLPIEMLQEVIARPERANLMLIAADSSAAETATLDGAVHRAMALADYGLALKWRETAGAFDVVSDRIFLDPEVAKALTRAFPDARSITSYLVNEFRAGNRSTPYSIAAGVDAEAAPFLPRDLGARELVANQWLADDLQLSVGQEVQLTYYQVGPNDALVERTTPFRVRSIVPLAGLAADRSWMPDFPGISDARKQSEWDPGLPLKLERVREKDERYWDEHRGAPKAFLSRAAAEELWSTRWGSVTAVRIQREREREGELTTALLQALRPEMNQLQVRDLRASAQAAAQSTVDFGGLFLGMSFFLIIAALGLVALLFQLSLLQRNREDALLGAVGLPAGLLLRWRMGEAAVILTAGALLGLPLAMLYSRGILRFLESIWAGQGASTFVFAARPGSIAIGVSAFLIGSLGAVWLAIRRQAKRALSVRLTAHQEELPTWRPAGRGNLVRAALALAVALAAVGLSGRVLPPQGAFYLAGSALLAAGILLCRHGLTAGKAAAPDVRMDPVYLGRLNLRTRRSRGLAVVGLIATAVFMVLSVASFRKHAGADWLTRASGTGGFTFLIETTVAQNLARDGRAMGGFEIFESQAAALGELLPLRLGPGDNANCFNLNTTSQPRLLAVPSGALERRGAFRLNASAGTGTGAAGWGALRQVASDGAVPAFVDETTLLWALKRKVGDLLSYLDENGRPFTVRIVGTLPDSLFQGYLLVDEQAFVARFPSHAGYALFLADAKKPDDAAALRGRLESAMADVGGRVDLTRDVLNAFHQIENTYIAIFNVLGSLGVVLGSLGLTIVVARNLRERRGEFAVMTAIGIPRPVLARMVFSEYGRLVGWGVAIGLGAAALAVWPNRSTLPAAPTLGLVGGLLVGIVILNLLCGWLVFRSAVRDWRPGMLGNDG